MNTHTKKVINVVALKKKKKLHGVNAEVKMQMKGFMCRVTHGIILKRAACMSCTVHCNHAKVLQW